MIAGAMTAEARGHASPFPPGDVHRRLSAVLRERFSGRRVKKIPLDAGFTCPNIDGTVARGGCIYCRNEAFHPGPLGSGLSVTRQLEIGIARDRRRGERLGPPRHDGYLAYFQTFTNTHAPLEELAPLWSEALAVDGVLGIVIATRPDCLPDQVLDRLEDIARGGRFVALEIGLQSASGAALEFANRAHTVADFEDAARRAGGRGIDVSAHVVFGFPGDDDALVRRTASLLAGLPLDGVKLHHLHVVKGTVLERMHARGEFEPVGRADYVRFAADFLERIPSRFAIHRLVATTPERFLVAPAWTREAAAVAREIEGTLRERGSFQGRLSPARPA